MILAPRNGDFKIFYHQDLYGGYILTFMVKMVIIDHWSSKGNEVDVQWQLVEAETETNHDLRYECLTPISQELCSTIFQSLSLSLFAMGNTWPDIHFFQYIKATGSAMTQELTDTTLHWPSTTKYQQLLSYTDSTQLHHLVRTFESTGSSFQQLCLLRWLCAEVEIHKCMNARITHFCCKRLTFHASFLFFCSYCKRLCWFFLRNASQVWIPSQFFNNIANFWQHNSNTPVTGFNFNRIWFSDYNWPKF